ncbi:CRP-like cAMP-binding protein [Bartonella japonica]|uniref:CRP-like cAMP-binding protein n=1 Tax=Bartonella japonica TaxID=357761 RepID=A0ABV2FMK9_9HYPH
MRDFWNRILLILFVFFVFTAIFFAFRSVLVHQFIFNRSFSSSSSQDQVNITEDAFLERLAVSFPDIVKELSQLSPQQQQQLIEQLRQEAIAFASANGQSDEQAQKLGEVIATVLSKVIAQPSIGSTYF